MHTVPQPSDLALNVLQLPDEDHMASSRLRAGAPTRSMAIERLRLPSSYWRSIIRTYVRSWPIGKCDVTADHYGVRYGWSKDVWEYAQACVGSLPGFLLARGISVHRTDQVLDQSGCKRPLVWG